MDEGYQDGEAMLLLAQSYEKQVSRIRRMRIIRRS